MRIKNSRGSMSVATYIGGDDHRIHLDVRRAACRKKDGDPYYMTLGATGQAVDDPHDVESTLAFLSHNAGGACPPLVRLNLTQTPLLSSLYLGRKKYGLILQRLHRVFRIQKLLKTVDFSWNQLGSAGVNKVLQALLQSGEECRSSIQQLFLYGNDIQDSPELEILGDLLEKNEQLQELHLGSNPGMGMISARALSRGLASPTCSLIELDLWCCRLGDEAGSVLIKEGVQPNKSLKILRLNLNDLSTKACRAISNMLMQQENEKHSLLQVLNLDSNHELFSQDDDDEATGLEFARVLGKYAKSLKHVGLPNTGMTDAVVAAIFTSLAEYKNDTLRFLDVGYNNGIERAGYDKMIESLPSLQGLQYLRTHARSQIMNVPKLVESVCLNTSLIRLTYICVGSVQDQNQMDAAFARNKALYQSQCLLKRQTTKHISSSLTYSTLTVTTTCRQQDDDVVPLGLWSLAMAKFAAAQQSPTNTSSTTGAAPPSALYTILTGQAQLWIQQHQQHKKQWEQEDEKMRLLKRRRVVRC